MTTFKTLAALAAVTTSITFFVPAAVGACLIAGALMSVRHKRTGA